MYSEHNRLFVYNTFNYLCVIVWFCNLIEKFKCTQIISNIYSTLETMNQFFVSAKMFKLYNQY